MGGWKINRRIRLTLAKFEVEVDAGLGNESWGLDTFSGGWVG